MWAMHRTDVDDCLGNRDSCGRDVQRSVALASSKFSCMIRVFERILGNSDNGHLAIERFVQMSPQSGTMVSVQPDIAIDDNASWWLIELGQHRLDAWQLSTIEFARLVVLHFVDFCHVFCGRAGVSPILDDNTRRSRCGVVVANIEARNHEEV